MRDIETKRLRLELRVANICTILQQRRAMTESRYAESVQEPILHPLIRSEDAALYNSMMQRSASSCGNMDVAVVAKTSGRNTEKSSIPDNLDAMTEYDDHPFHLSDLQKSTYDDEHSVRRDWIISPGAGRYMRSAIGSLKEDDEAEMDAHRKNTREMMRVAVNLLHSEYGVSSVHNKDDDANGEKGGEKGDKEGQDLGGSPSKGNDGTESEPTDAPPLEHIVSNALHAFSLPHEADGNTSDATPEPIQSSPQRVLSKSQSLPTPAKTPEYCSKGHLLTEADLSPPTRRKVRKSSGRKKSIEKVSPRDELKNKVPRVQRKSRTQSPQLISSPANPPAKIETDLNALSMRLNEVADKAVADSLGSEHVGSSNPDVKMVRQEAVIAELLSIVLQGSAVGANRDVGSDDVANKSEENRRDILEDVSLDDVVFLLREQQQELEEIRQIASKQNKGKAPTILHSETSLGSGGKVNGFYNGVHHSPISPILAETEESTTSRGRSVRISLSSPSPAPRATPSPDTRGVGGPGGRDRTRSESPARSTSSSKWIGGGTASSYHIQAQDNRFDYPPVNSLSQDRGRSESPVVRGRSRLSREQMDRRVRSRSGSRDNRSRHISPSSPEGNKRGRNGDGG